jgi:alcohol dehydrogenase (cytochrome c)
MKHALALLLLAGCASAPVLPPTHDAKTITSFNAASPGVAPNAAQNVTYDRLTRARSEPQNWMTYYGTYDGQRYSALDQINAGNVANLGVAWVFQHGPMTLMPAHATYAFEATPIVVDGIMYVSGWDGFVWALDARDGRLLWEYQHAIPLDAPLCCGNINRGVAVGKGKVVYTTPDAHIIALDAATGKPAWDQVLADIRSGESATAAPLIVKNLVLAGTSGGEFGVRGHIDAFDLDSGRRVWRHYTIPKPGEPGAETWGSNDTWTRGGGPTWVTGTFDPELNLVYWGTGNPGPDFRNDARPGRNLYTNSVLALDPDSGAQRWFHQWTPADVWDYDGVGENILFDAGGRKLLAHADKNGYLFILDRTDGRFVRAVKFTETTWGDVDPATGTVTPHLFPTEQGTVIAPGPSGGKDGFPHGAYSPQTGLVYIPVMHNRATYKSGPAEFREGLPWWGGDVDTASHPHTGSLKAFDPRTGAEAWSFDSQFPMAASILATAGHLVFTGEPDGHFDAWDAATGKLLWRFQTGSGIHSSPIAYSVDGKEYIAVPSGWGGWVAGIAPNMATAPRGDALYVFALPSR